MHWLASNWLLVLTSVVAVLSEIMPYLPGKAQNVVGAVLEVGKLVAGKVKPAALPAWKDTPENPKGL